MENRASQAHKAYILLSIPQYDEMFLPNFRTGDVVVLYERNNDLDNATNKMVLRVILSRLQIQNCVFVYVLPNVMLPFFLRTVVML